MRAAAIAVLALVAGCKSPEAPGGFGVDLTITLDGASRAGLAQVLINVTGAEEYAATLPASAFPDGTGQLHYIPGAHAGTISIGATAQDGAGATLGAGNSGPITLTDGKSVAATVMVTMGGSSSGDGGAGDMSSGLKALGAMCGFDNECDSGHCVDGFCCGVPSCGTCQNCGNTGMCTAVTNKDDNSGMTCNGQKSCDAAGMCKDRWVLLHGDSSSSLGGRNWCAGTGNVIFFQGNSGATKSIDVSASSPVFVTEGSLPYPGFTNSPFAAVGTKVYVLDSMTITPALYAIDVSSASPRMWSSLAGPSSWRGEPGFAGGNGKLYLYGGRDSANNSQKTLFVYDIAGNTWTNGPDGTYALQTLSAGFASGKLYIIGGDAVVGTSSATFAFDPMTSLWTNLMAVPPSGVFESAAVSWRNKVAVLIYSKIHTFDITTGQWDTVQIPVPTALQNATCVATAGSPANLYMIGDAATGTEIWAYNL